MWKTPGVWEDIPSGARIVATRKGTTLNGVAVQILGRNRDKRLELIEDNIGNVAILASDQWEVKFDQPTLGEELAKLRVGSTFAHNKGGYPRYMKIDHEHAVRLMMDEGYHQRPEIVALNTMNISPDYYSLIEV